MKMKKGAAGYISSRKRFTILRTTAYFAIVIALIVLGIWQTGDRLNYLTLIAVLGCLPAGKSLVEVIMFLPHHSVDKQIAAEVEAKTEHLTTAFDLILTSEKSIMPVDCIAISDNTICGYTSSKKTDTTEAANHLKKYLGANHFTKVSVKIFDSYTAFVTRAEGMNNIAAIEKDDAKEHEMAMRSVILNLSL